MLSDYEIETFVKQIKKCNSIHFGIEKSFEMVSYCLSALLHYRSIKKLFISANVIVIPLSRRQITVSHTYIAT